MRRLMRMVTVVLVISSVVIEWLFLTGSPPTQQALAAAFLPATTATPVARMRPNFQTGVVFPRWGANAYTASDPNYGIGLGEIQDQTGARWIEITLNFYQVNYNSTTIYAGEHTPTPASLAEGIALAHARGFHVFVAPLLSLDNPAANGWSHWSGSITFTRKSDITAWFENYWLTLKPYMEAAQRAGAEQFAIGTEMARLELVPDVYWYWLIQQAHSVFTSHLTYDMNFSTIGLPVRNWMRDPNLWALGVSLYASLANNPLPLPADEVSARWVTNAGQPLDLLATRAGKPVIISEIGYRNATDALYFPSRHETNVGPDPELQAAAYNAALLYTLCDPRIAGIYFWAWSLPPFSPNWLPAAHAMKTWYTSALA